MIVPVASAVNFRCGIATILWTALAQATLSPAAVPVVGGFERVGRHGTEPPAIAGRVLLTELNCTACHRPDLELFPHLAPKGGPRLTQAGRRLNAKWVQQFLINPQAVKPGTTMPDVLAQIPTQQRPRIANALAAYLRSQNAPLATIKASGATPVPFQFWQRGDARAGRQRFHQVGCVACHEPEPGSTRGQPTRGMLDEVLQNANADELKAMGLADIAQRTKSIPLVDLADKYTRRGLALFLINPHDVRPNGRMPDFQLSPSEAADLVAYLFSRTSDSELLLKGGASNRRRPATKQGGPVATSLEEQGRQWFARLGCANCHETNATIRTTKAMPLAKLVDRERDQSFGSACWQQGGKDARGAQPYYLLDQRQQQSLKLALQSNTAAHQAAELQLLKLGCLACHQRNGKGGVERHRRVFFATKHHVDLGDEGRLPPPLTGVGSKLRVKWLRRALSGQLRLRPYMEARMPAFGVAAVESLPARLRQADANWLSARIGQRRQTAETTAADVQLASIGRALFDAGCVQCHPIHGKALPGVVGIDLANLADRLRPNWFHAFLLTPTEIKPRTRMPTFFSEKRSIDESLLNGDADLQILALWHYLASGGTLRLPAKIEQAQRHNYELVPRQRPILLRTFMKHAGTHAIAVGYPERVHFAFDAWNVSLAEVWRGRFINARGTWFDRFSPAARPLGPAQPLMVGRSEFARLNSANAPWPAQPSHHLQSESDTPRFSGYQLDSDGIPTFQYSLNHFRFDDRLTPDGHQALTRRIRIWQAANVSNRSLATQTSISWDPLYFCPLVNAKRLTATGAVNRAVRLQVGSGDLTVTLWGDLGDAARVGENRGWRFPVRPDQKEKVSEAVIKLRYQWP